MTTLSNKSLAQIVSGNHKAALVLEKYHLDFCCKGKRTLEQACSENNIAIQDVVTELEKADQPDSSTARVNFENLPLSLLADYIISTHHSYVKKEMPAIQGYLQKVAAKHGDRHPEVRKVLALFSTIAHEMEHHMQKEELVLFPRIREAEQQPASGQKPALSPSYIQAPITVMEQEHEQAGLLMAQIRELTNNYEPPIDACTTFRLSYACLQAFELDLHQHVHLENNILFPKAISLFNEHTPWSLN